MARTNAILDVRRRGRRATAAALAGAALVAIAFAAPTAMGAGVPRSFYGIDPTTPLTQSDFDRMSSARVGSIRLGFDWPSIQPDRLDSPEWGSIDQAITRAALENISILPILFGTPAYEAEGCTGTTCTTHIHIKTKRQRRDWQAFVKASVRRYGSGGEFWSANPGLPYEPITRWEIWNEQNNPGQRAPARLYSRLLKAANAAIHAADPTAKTILGGMFGTPRGGSKTTAWSYLRRLYGAGAGNDFEGVALHPYSTTISGIGSQIERVRRVLRRHDDGDRQILVTEIGWGSSRRRYPGTRARGAVFNVSPKQQRRKLARSFALLTKNRRRWRIGAVYWFEWQDPKDPPPGLCAFCYSSGLYKADGETAKPALSAYERFTGAARG